jgi:hypothetical protein
VQTTDDGGAYPVQVIDVFLDERRVLHANQVVRDFP